MTSRSLYEALFPLSTIMKQRVVDNFDATVLNERWNETNNSETNTFQMVDEVDEGFEIETVSAISNAEINFNDIRQYDFDNMVVIAEVRETVSSNYLLRIGANLDISGNTEVMWRETRDGVSFTSLRTFHQSSNTITNTTVSESTSWGTVKLVGSSANTILFEDGVLEVTSTANIPAGKAQPQLQGLTRIAGATHSHRIRYYEAYQT